MPSFFFWSFATERIQTNTDDSLFGFFPYEKKIFQGTMRNMNSHLHSSPCPTLNSQLVLVLLFGLIPVLTLLTAPGFNSETTVWFSFKEPSKYKAWQKFSKCMIPEAAASAAPAWELVRKAHFQAPPHIS